MSEDLIEVVRERRVLYDPTCKDYRDHSVRNAAWEEISEILNEPVEKCKEDWKKLRNAFVNAMKRKKKSGQAAVGQTPCKYEAMSFLLPSIEPRSKLTNLIPPTESPAVGTNEDLNERPPATSNARNSQASTPENQSKKPKIQGIYDLMKSSLELRSLPKNNMPDMDETDLFFLSMSKSVKALPKLEQTKIKLGLYTAVSQAEICQIENRPNYPPPIQRSIQLPSHYPQPSYFQPSAHLTSPIYIDTPNSFQSMHDQPSFVYIRSQPPINSSLQPPTCRPQERKRGN